MQYYKYILFFLFTFSSCDSNYTIRDINRKFNFELNEDEIIYNYKNQYENVIFKLTDEKFELYKERIEMSRIHKMNKRECIERHKNVFYDLRILGIMISDTCEVSVHTDRYDNLFFITPNIIHYLRMRGRFNQSLRN